MLLIIIIFVINGNSISVNIEGKEKMALSHKNFGKSGSPDQTDKVKEFFLIMIVLLAIE